MIITQFSGRLGNQLFEYAAIRKIAHDNNTELKFDLRNYSQMPGAHTLQFFNIIENIATEKEISKLKNKGIIYYLERFLPYYKRRVVWEKDGVFDKNLINIKRKNMYLRGYFQSEKYFEGIQNIIRKEFTLKEPVDNKYEEIIDKIRETNSVSIHIRRGDILLGKVTSEKPCMTTDYYKKAVNYISEKINNPHFFIFSDDINWAKENLKFINPIFFVSRDGMRDYEELIIMSKCKHNIIGNSTFSWWGAWLNENSRKIVVNPKHWFIDPEKNLKYTSHLILDSWITLW